MSEPLEYANKAALLRDIAEFLYGRARDCIAVDDVYKALPLERSEAIDFALKKMDALELISLQLREPVVRTLGYGKTCFEQGCVPEVILGADYVAKKYRGAVVHIIVEGDAGESGGTGFFWADHPDHIATAGHVVSGRKILRIEGNDGSSIPVVSGDFRVGSGDLDLAVLECKLPGSVQPIRVEWRPDAVSLGAQLIVFGYPKIAFHHPSLYQSKAELHSTPKRYASPRDSLIVSGTHPGCSGGPVIDHRGFAIGVVEQENIIEQKAGTNTYFSATPTRYLRELVSSVAVSEPALPKL
jgi:hypothetical protein